MNRAGRGSGPARARRRDGLGARARGPVARPPPPAGAQPVASAAPPRAYPGGRRRPRSPRQRRSLSPTAGISPAGKPRRRRSQRGRCGGRTPARAGPAGTAIEGRGPPKAETWQGSLGMRATFIRSAGSMPSPTTTCCRKISLAIHSSLARRDALSPSPWAPPATSAARRGTARGRRAACRSRGTPPSRKGCGLVLAARIRASSGSRPAACGFAAWRTPRSRGRVSSRIA